MRLFRWVRKSEWLQLNWEDVDFDEMVIRFNKTKNKHPREVPIVPGLMYETLAEARRLKDAAWPDESAVFLYDGVRMATVGSAWHKAWNVPASERSRFMTRVDRATKICGIEAYLKERG